MKGIIFDMDGVLIDAMPFHAEAMKLAIKEETDYEIDKKIVYKLEGMPSDNLVKEIFKKYNIKKELDQRLIEKISERKKEIFKEIEETHLIEGVRDLIEVLNECKCVKAIVTGAAKKEIELTIDKMIGLKNFDVVVSGEDVDVGKPNSAPFVVALQKMNIKPSECIVVENAPLGVEAANKAGIRCILTLNNTPLDISSDFNSLLSKETQIFRDTKSTIDFLRKWCCNN
ncbi:MAG TPA: HAD-IA family hydrolase [Nitrososphaeraceae archaeon]|nr:HAD-IA family hydrolase [Nitrososphaeraceae archaeon]